MLKTLGMKSLCRKLIYEKLGLVDKATPTGDAAFRACIPLENVTDPELRAFVTEPVATRWMGEGRHIQAYPIRHGNLYNMVRMVSFS
jgi:salicylate hydroxylase